MKLIMDSLNEYGRVMPAIRHTLKVMSSSARTRRRYGADAGDDWRRRKP